MKKFLCLMLAIVLCLSFTACKQKEIVVAEMGSAGETLAKENEYFKDYEYVAVDSMATALMEVKSGTADAAIIDYVTALGSVGEGTDYDDLAVVEGIEFNPEEYGIAFRKNSDVTPVVNGIIAELMNDGTMDKIAEKYNLSSLLIKDGEPKTTETVEGDLKYIQDKGVLVIGITLFAPMNYKENNELTGFETEFAKAVCEKLGVKAEFVEIKWDSKEMELNNKSIDCIWNGMTITDERMENMSISAPYMNNKQVVVKKAK